MGRRSSFQNRGKNSRYRSTQARRDLALFQSFPGEIRGVDGTPRHHSRALPGSRQVDRARNQGCSFARRTRPIVARVLRHGRCQAPEENPRSPFDLQTFVPPQIPKKTRREAGFSNSPPQKKKALEIIEGCWFSRSWIF